jgi:hypothetical protein
MWTQEEEILRLAKVLLSEMPSGKFLETEVSNGGEVDAPPAR